MRKAAFTCWEFVKLERASAILDFEVAHQLLSLCHRWVNAVRCSEMEPPLIRRVSMTVFKRDIVVFAVSRSYWSFNACQAPCAVVLLIIMGKCSALTLWTRAALALLLIGVHSSTVAVDVKLPTPLPLVICG
jgi:hypothetical protein